jgi:hypothetical protein
LEASRQGPPPGPVYGVVTSAHPEADEWAGRLVEAESAGDTGEPKQEAHEARVAAARAFVTEHPDVETWGPEVVAYLGRYCDAETFEAAYAVVQEHRKPNPPTSLAVEHHPWRAVVILGRACGTSEDWGWFTAEVSHSLPDDIEVVTVYPGDATVVLTRAGAEVDRLDVGTHFDDDQLGYLLAMEGKPPEFVTHAMSQDVLTAASAYFGAEIELKPI